MKRFLLSFVFVILCGGYSFAYNFSAVCESGQTLYYYIISREEPYTVEIVAEDEFAGLPSAPEGGDLEIPETVTYDDTTYSVVSIYPTAFWNANLTSVSIPKTVTNIGDRGNDLSSCSALTHIVVANDNPVYDSRDNCNAIIKTSTNVLVCGCRNTTIPSSVTSIGTGAFFRCSGLTEITIPNSVTRIGDEVFYNCSALTSVTIPNSVTSIGQYAFSGCSGLTEITIPNSVTSIESSLFYNCSALASITIGNEVTSIGREAFYGCSSLTEITIPNSVTRIDSGAFRGCTGLVNVIMSPGSDETITGFIGPRSFAACTNLTSVTIGRNFRSIERLAFDSCFNISEIKLYAVNPPRIYDNSFNGVSVDIPVYVPCNTTQLYIDDEMWGMFTNIQLMEGAEFQYEASVDVAESCSNLGSVEVLRHPDCYDNNFIIKATANEGYIFVRWNDGNTENPRQIAIEHDSTFSAVFGILNEVTKSYCSIDDLGDQETGSFYSFYTNADGMDSVFCLNIILEQPLETTIRVVATNEHNKNVVTWNPVSNNTMLGYLVYRQDAYGQYEIMDTIAIDAECTWTDEVSNTAVRPYRYTVATLDSCGNISEMSASHKTIHLQISLGQDNSRNLSWTDYEGFDFSTYRVYRYTTLEDMEMIAEMSRENHTYTDLNTEHDYYYMIEIVQGRSPIISRSNIVSSNPNAIETDQMSAELALFPNPAKDILNITSSETISEVEIVNVMGQVVRRIEVNSDNAVCDVNELKAGVYMVRIRSAKSDTSTTFSVRRFVKE